MIAPPVTRKRFTTREYEQIIAAGVIAEDDRVELLEGEIVEMSPLGPRHAACVARLTSQLYKLGYADIIIRVQDPVRLADYSEPQPDIAVVQRRADYYSDSHPEPEDILLLIEVAETSLSYDRDLKLPLYARASIPEVWIVALLPQVIEVYRSPGDNGYDETQQFRRGDSLSAINLPELALTVDAVLG